MSQSYRKGRQSPLKSYADHPSAARYLYEGLPSDVRTAFSQPSSLPRLPVEKWDVRMKSFVSSCWQHCPRRISYTKIVLVLLWVLVLRWGEKTAFSTSVKNCSWGSWEDWVCLGLQ